MNTAEATSLQQAIDRHVQEFKASAIADDIAALNFRSFDGENENDLNEAFTLLIEEPKHNNNGTLSGKSQNDLANALRSSGWIYQGHRGVCIKPNIPRVVDGKIIKYESPRGDGSLQLFIPRVSWTSGRKIAAKAGSILEAKYLERMDANANPSDEDCGFWEWFRSTELPLSITEGAKKVCSLISAGYPAIALNGVWGWGTNERDMFGNVEKDDRGHNLKIIHPDLEPFLDGREIVLAFDRDSKTETVRMVEVAKAALVRSIGDDETPITQLIWKSPKGIDDYIAAKGEKELDRMFGKRKECKPPKPERVKDSDRLLEIGKTPCYFHTTDKIAYADIWIEGNRHTYPVRSKAFRLWLSGEFYKKEGKGISSQTLQDTLNTFEAIAIFEGQTHEVHLRTAEHQGKIYLDLGTPDWKAIEVDDSGWRIAGELPVRFWRPDSLLPLPYPVEGGNLDELKELINVDRQSWILIATFLLFCFCPDRRYPILVITAHRGSGKTAAAETLKGLIDPGKAPLIKLSGDTQKLAVAGKNRLLLVYDNVGHISPDQSDDLCRVATKFGHSTRTLFSTDEETTIDFTRPQIITAIDALITRDDLADRVLTVKLGEISEDCRLPQSELDAKVEAARPRILGALLTALSQTLAQLPHTNPDVLPRMADYAKFAIAAEGALDLEEGEFSSTFNQSREQSRAVVIESSPVGEAILSLMRDRLVWKGTASELLSALEKHTDEATYRSRFFPKAANTFKRNLNRLAPDLKALGIDISESRLHGGNRQLVLEKVVKVSSPSSPLPNKNLEPNYSNKNGGDDNGDDGVTIKPSGDDKPVGDDTVTSDKKLSSPLQPQLQSESQRLGDDGDNKNLAFSKLLENKINVGDRVKRISTGERGKLGMWYRDRRKATIEFDDGTMSDWIEADDLRLLGVEAN